MDETDALVEAVARAVSASLYGRDMLPNDFDLIWADGSPAGKSVIAARAIIPIVAAAERVRIVAWLRAMDANTHRLGQPSLGVMAAAIEKGACDE